MRSLLLSLVASSALLAGCGPSAQCGSTQGFVFGTVQGGASPIEVEFRVMADGTDIENAEVDGRSYELDVEGGVEVAVWAVDAEGCQSPDAIVRVDTCEEVELDLVITAEDCVTADKPNLYLHPDVDTEVSVRLEHDPRQRVFASAPPYRDGWRGVAHPDGTFTADGATAPFLFYEITLLPAHVHAFQRRAVDCVQGGPDAAADMAALLGSYGFDGREQDDFIAAWADALPPAPVYAVYPQTDVDDAVRVLVEPPMPVHRVWLLVEPAAACTPISGPPIRVDADGPHAREWGVVLRGF